jgi:hypothetical protein
MTAYRTTAYAITSPPLSLTILRQGERLFVDLAEVGTLIPRGETRVEDAFLREVAAELRLLATPGFSHGETREVRETVLALWFTAMKKT